jgi:tetratricopeptide (TPR) repeat protein
MNQHNLAVEDFTAALDLDSKFYEAYCSRGNAHFRAGRGDLAVKDYDAALKLNPGDGDLYFNRGLVLRSLGQGSAAANDFRTAASMGNKNAIGYMQTASAVTTKK